MASLPDFFDGSAKSRLRIYAPDPAHAAPLDGGRLTLREVFEARVLPRLIAIKRGTIAEYRAAITAWERLTANPSLSQLTDDHAEQLRIGAAAQIDLKKLSPATYNKWARHLRALLSRLAPRDTRNPRGLGLIPFAPLVETLPERLAEPRVATRGELSRIYQACTAATWPLIPDPGEAWRLWLVLSYNCGARRSDLWGLTWGAIQDREQLLTLRAEKTGKPLRLPLHPTLLAHLQSWRRSAPDAHPAAKIFPFTQSHRHFYGQLYRLQSLAGIGTPLTPQDLRHTCGSAFDDLAPGLGAIVLGHAPKGVFEKYYRNASRRLRKAVRRLPQPKAFLRILATVDDRQKKLF